MATYHHPWHAGRSCLTRGLKHHTLYIDYIQRVKDREAWDSTYTSAHDIADGTTPDGKRNEIQNKQYAARAIEECCEIE